MDGKERDFKTHAEQWKVIVQYLEEHPILLKNKFLNSDGDNLKQRQIWTNLCEHLNSMGYGSRTVEKWQTAIARWKSKTKGKASVLRREMEKTGGGPCKAPPLNPIEECLMGLMGWKSITGDGNQELGFASKTPIEASQAATHPNQSTSKSVTSTIDNAVPSTSMEFLPPLVRINSEVVNKVADCSGHKRPFEANTEAKKVKVRRTTEKSRKFVSMHAMHKENQESLKNIEKNAKSMADSLENIKDTFNTYVNILMAKEKENN